MKCVLYDPSGIFKEFKNGARVQRGKRTNEIREHRHLESQIFYPFPEWKTHSKESACIFFSLKCNFNVKKNGR